MDKGNRKKTIKDRWPKTASQRQMDIGNLTMTECKGNSMHKDRWTKATGCTKTDGQRQLDAQRPMDKGNHKKTDGKGNKRTN